MVDMAYPRDDARFRDGNGETGIDVVGDPDDPPVRDVPDDRVEHFERYGWERVDADDADDEDATGNGSDADAAAADEESESESESDGDGFGNAAEGFDAESFVDRTVGPISDDLESGDYDRVLDSIEDAEKADGSPRNTVMDAIDDRRGA